MWDDDQDGGPQEDRAELNKEASAGTEEEVSVVPRAQKRGRPSETSNEQE